MIRESWEDFEESCSRGKCRASYQEIQLCDIAATMFLPYCRPRVDYSGNVSAVSLMSPLHRHRCLPTESKATFLYWLMPTRSSIRFRENMAPSGVSLFGHPCHSWAPEAPVLELQHKAVLRCHGDNIDKRT